MMHVRPTKWFLRFLSMAFASAVMVILWITPVQPSLWREQVIPILGVTLDDRHISGAVATVRVSFAERLDHSGLLERPRPFFSDGANGDRAGRLSDGAGGRAQDG